MLHNFYCVSEQKQEKLQGSQKPLFLHQIVKKIAEKVGCGVEGERETSEQHNQKFFKLFSSRPQPLPPPSPLLTWSGYSFQSQILSRSHMQLHNVIIQKN